MKSYDSHSLEETKEIVDRWLGEITELYAGSDKALVVGLSGHLGAGKTAYVKMVAKNLGIKEEITSPTFVIMKIFETKHKHWKKLIHIDAYRLERREDIEVLQWEKIISNPENLIMIEWPEKVGLSTFSTLANLSLEIVEGVHKISIE